MTARWIHGSLVGLAVLVLAGCWGSPSGSGTSRGSANKGKKNGAPGITEDLVQRNNAGVALMCMFQYKEATAHFEKLAEDYPDSDDVLHNLAIAYLNADEGGKHAIPTLQRILERNPRGAGPNYCMGLLRFYQYEYKDAIPFLEQSLLADPKDAFAEYLLGKCWLELGSTEEAKGHFLASVDRDPFFWSPLHGLGEIERRSGKLPEFNALRARIEAIQKSPLARGFQTKYTQMGPKAEVVAIGQRAPSRSRPEGGLFLPPQPIGDPSAQLAAATRSTCVTVADVNGDERLDVFVAGGLAVESTRGNAIWLQKEDGQFELAADHPLAKVTDVRAALWGDINDDGRVDAYLCRAGANQLWLADEGGTWTDATSASGTAGNGIETVDGALVDADHDGDLDLLLAHSEGPFELLSNNRDGTFRSIAEQAGIVGTGKKMRGLLVVDVDHDLDLDIVLVHDEPDHELFLNDLTWKYHAGQAEFLTARADVVAAADLNSDGLVEILTADASGITRWSHGNARWSSSLLEVDQASAGGWQRLALADVDGDGRPELLAASSTEWNLYRVGDAKLTQVAGEHGDPLFGCALAVLDEQRGPSLIGVGQNPVPAIHRPGPGRFPFVTIRLTGKAWSVEEPHHRSNRSGIGTRLELRVRGEWHMADSLRADSGPGQSDQPIAIGIGAADQADFLRLIWPDAVMQGERQLRPGICRIAEENRIPTSCPVLLTWNGERYEFASDLLGVGGLGYLVAPHEYAPADPTENFLIPAGKLVPSDGRYRLKLTEPMEEVTYLDHVALVAYDLPPRWRMTLDERMGVNPPLPTGKPRFYRRWVTAARAVNDRGDDVTRRVADADHLAANPGPLDPRFIGKLAKEHVLVLEFDQPLGGGSGEPLLIADGWIEYPYSQTAFAAWQARERFVAPTIEARGTDGRWEVVLREFGYPAGMPRQMSVPLAGLPDGTTALRISTNQEIYWDRIVVAFSEPCPNAKRSVLPLVHCELAEFGFMPRHVCEHRRPEFFAEERVPFFHVRDPAGYYTRFGEVGELIGERDDAVAIFGPGEQIHCEFAAPGAEPRDGWTRALVLETVGWCKDMDLYTGDGQTVEPLPFQGPATARRDELHRRFNTRYQQGRQN